MDDFKPVVGAENIPEAGATDITLPDVDVQAQASDRALLGYKETTGLQSDLKIGAARNAAHDEAFDVKPGDPLPPQLRQTYADAVVSRETIGPDEFSDIYHASGHPPIEGLAGMLPSHEDLDNHALGITHDAELPLIPEFLDQVKANLADAWAQTGMSTHDLYVAAVNNPAISDALTSPPPPPPEPVEMPKESGAFDPLMHGASAVANFVGNIPGFVQDRAHEIVRDLGNTPLPKDIADAVETFKSELAEQAKTPMSLELKPGDVEKAMSIALATGGALRVVGSIKGMFRTSAQMAAGAEKAAAKEFVQGTVREQTGLARRDIAQASAKLEEYRGDINKALPEYQDWLAGDALTRSQVPRPMIQNLNDYMEGRSTGAALDPKSPFAPVADAIRDIYKDIRNTIETNYPDTLRSFYDDYVRHMWTDPAKADRLMGGGRMGSGASTKMRTIPTISDGIDLGLVPRDPDPISNTIQYVDSMRKFIAQQETLRLGQEHGYVQYSMGGGPPEAGWKALSGRGSAKNFIYQDANGVDQVGTQQAYAHPGFAGSYNNWVGKGFHESPILGKIYDKMQYAANMLTGLKLGLSGYHAFNIAQESAVAGLADGIGNIAHGELADAIKQIIPSATIFPQPVKQFLRGKAFQEQYLGIKDHGPEMERIVDLYTRGGGRATPINIGLIGQDNAMQRGFDVWNPTKWSENAQKEWGDLKFAARDNPDNTALTSGLLKGGRVASEVGSWVGQTMSGVVKPLFENAIPKIKNAAFADEMSSWLKANPMASQDAQVRMARKLVDSMDDRFGELIQDNLFWPRWIKQSLNLATISVGWEYGTLRAFGGAAKDIASGDLLSPRARWLYSFPLTMGIMGSAYQYAKTGTLPTQTDTPIHDMIAPRTGGTVTYFAKDTPEGKAYPHQFPERAQLPGYQKDPEQWYSALRNAPDYTQIPPAALNIGFNKLSPMWRLGYGVATGKDPFTGTVIRAHPDVPGWKDYANFVLKEAVTPIGIGQLSERRKGTNVSDPERMMGLRPIGQNLAAPESAEQYHKFLFEKAQKEAQDREASHDRSLEGGPEKTPAKAVRQPIAPPAPMAAPPQEAPPAASPGDGYKVHGDKFGLPSPDEESDGPPMPPHVPVEVRTGNHLYRDGKRVY